MSISPPFRLPPRRRRWPLIAALAVLALAAAWSALWTIAAVQGGAAFDGWIGREAAAGRVWTCPARRIGGFPFAFDVRCDRPTFHGEVAGRLSDGIVEGLRATAGLAHPRSVAVELDSPLTLRAANDDFVVMVSWESLRTGVEVASGRPSRGTLETTRLAFTLTTPDPTVAVNLRAAHVSGDAAPTGADGDDAAFAFRAARVTLPTLDPMPGLAAETDLDGEGTLVHADLLRAPNLAQLEAWRHAGGRLQLAELSVANGDLRARASGRLGLDATHRPAGKLDATVSGFEPLAAQFGIPLAGVKLGGLLSDLLGGHKAAAPAGSIQLPIVFSEGQIFLGPFRTGARIDPLY